MQSRLTFVNFLKEVVRERWHRRRGMRTVRWRTGATALAGALIVLLSAPLAAAPPQVPPELFEIIGVPDFVDLPEHASSSQVIRLNRRALLGSSFVVELMGDRYIAVRDRLEQHRPGELV
jgi:hypothetical protein